jgi:hypothetical protein
MKNRTLLARCRPAVEPLEDRLCPSFAPGTPVPGFTPGTQLLVYVTLQAQGDTGETGEGESAFLYGSAHAGPLGFVEQYGQPEAFAVQAKAANETFSVQFFNGDGDEGTPNINVQIVRPGRISAQQAEALDKAAGQLETLSAADQQIYQNLFNAHANPAVIQVFLDLTAKEAAEAKRLRLLLGDPPDPNFKRLARAVTPHVSLFKAHADGLTAAAANAINALDKNQAQSKGVEEAIFTSFNRADGADQAQNLRWEQRQLRAAVKFEHELARLSQKQIALRLKAAHALQSVSSLASMQVTTNEVVSFQSDVSSSGLPAPLAAALQTAGLDQNGMAALTEAFIDLDPTQVAGDVTHALADPAFLQSLQGLSSSLRS